MSFYKLNLALLVLLLSACATSTERFPTFGEQAKSHQTVAIVLDLFVYQDIAGFDRGVDSTVRSETVSAATQMISDTISERGFTPRIIASLEGATYQFDPKDKYVVS
ncbi:MAG: hypothetical protein AAF431_05455 [Pseudomonadota bacterium]